MIIDYWIEIAVAFGLAVDHLYTWMGISPLAVLGRAAEVIPTWMEWAAAFTLIILSIKPFYAKLRLHPRTGADAASGTDLSPSACKTPT